MYDSGSNGKKSVHEEEKRRRHKLKTERLRRRDTWQKKIKTTIEVNKPQATRRTGIDILGNVPWGTHLCVFYQNKQDLIDILVPYFKAGLENNEFCMWITSEPLNAGEAEESLKQAVNNLDDYIEKGRIEILDYNQWYTKSGKFEPDQVIQDWMEKYEQTGKRQFEGLRVAGNNLWLQEKEWGQFADYERTIDEITRKHHMLAICTYCLDTCSATQVVDVVSSHKFTIIKRQGNWEIVENSQLRNTNRALQNAVQQWKTTFNTTQDSIILIDPDFTILKANQATSKLLSKPLDEILGSKCYELFHGTHTPPDVCPHKKAKETKKHEEAELHIPDKDIWVEISTDPILDDNGSISGTVHVVRNITEPRNMKEALKTSEIRFRSLIEQTTDAVFCFEYDPPIPTDLPIAEQVKLLYNGVLAECNDVCAKSYGAQRADEVIGKRLTELFGTTPTSLDKLFTAMVDQDYRIVDGEGVEKLEDGTERYYLNNGHGIVEEDKLIRVWGTFRDITERKRAEKALRENQEKMRSLLELSPDFIVIVNPDHTIQFINRVVPGMSLEQVIGKSVYEFVETQYHTDVRKAISQTFTTGQSCSLVAEGIYHDGRLGWFENRLAPIKQNGSISAVMVVSTDITKRRKAEEELKQSREFLANAINALDDSFFVKDEEHRWTVFNNAACKAIGRPREELIGKSDYDFFPKEQADVFWEKDNHVLETGETSVNEEEITWQGKLHTISTKKSLFKDSLTGKRFIVGTVRDITAQKQMEKTLRESEQKHRALVEQSIHGIVILQDYRIVFANKKAAEIAGLTVDEVKSLSLEEMMAFIPPEDREATLQRFMNRLDGKKEPENYVLRIVLSNGEEFWLNLFFSNIEYQGKFAVQVTFVDITDQKRMEEALRRSEKRFRDIFENTAVGIYRTTPDGRVLMANPALVNMLGYSSFEELSRRDLEEEGFEPQYLRSRFKEKIERKGRIDSWESVWITREGKKLHVIENARIVKDEEGDIMYYEGTAENITERKKAEEALRESEQRYRAIFEQAANSIVLIDVESGEFVEFNDRAHKNLGYSREEFRKLKISDFEVIESAEETKRHLDSIVRNGLDSFETKHRTKEGEIRDIQVSSRAISIRDKDFVQSIWYDITDRKKAEEALTESEEKFRNLAEQSPNMIFINQKGRVVYANEKCEELMGYKREEFCHPDFDFMTLIAPEFRQLIRTNLGRHIKGEEIKPYEYGLITKDDKRLDTIITTKLIKYGGENSILGIITDITERKKTQEEITKLAKFPAEDPNPVLRISKDGTILYANSTSSIVLDTWDRKVGERLPEGCRERIEEVFNSGTASTFEFQCNNGQIFEVKLAPVVESGYANAYGLDITERKQAVEQLRQREQTLRAFLNAPTESAILVDTEGTILDINTIGAKRLGKSTDEIIGMGIYDYLPSDVAEYRMAKGNEVIRSNKPLRFQDERAGRYYDNNIYPVFDDEGRISALAVFSGDITERKQAEERVCKYQGQLKSLASQLTLAEERERRRIAIELHDEISQSLFISKIKLEELQKSGPDKTFDETLNEINDSLGRIITSMRSLIFDLSSPVLYELGFEEAVAEWLTEQVERKYDIATEFEDDGLPKPLDDDIRVILFRNVRELLINVVKHARAKNIKVSIRKIGSRIHVSVEDDGVGFDSAGAESLITGKEAFGLFSIRERLEHLGGNLEIDSSPGCGCRITITSPLKREKISKDKQR
ncbi:MAG: PAS domain S-box protein [Phycisphaerae bacterium]|nr:PAS domain S-box protein [Phycisphaerae bacterium]NIP51455.1 PAS domain S-box protein [Phycisphaerae bacterium]NIS50659.1 PAS domain S-box protein [Phycisphaerae bacterium]NIU08392.1 PAS domain S-box protein [Phycisphaerae bacterium]NIU55891.1 PAS domain S-box protein [Phycisphaerae bacterium]